MMFFSFKPVKNIITFSFIKKKTRIDNREQVSRHNTDKSTNSFLFVTIEKSNQSHKSHVLKNKGDYPIT